MTSIKPDEAQRTLLITSGELARTAGETFADKLAKRPGPENAIAIVHCAGGAADDDFLLAVTEALTAISPPDLAARLAQKGWTLAAVDEIVLILALDVSPENSRIAAPLLDAVTAVIHQHLGLETASLLIWLAGAAGETAVLDCLSTPLSVNRAIIPLGLRNEAGLRLPDDNALSAMTAELLWALTATPLRTLPEQLFERQGAAFTGYTAVLTLGLAGWAWSPASAHAAFVRRWLESVLAHWLTTADETEPAEQAAVWMQDNGLSPESFAASALKEEETLLPDFLTAAWQFPWPWRLRRLFTEMRFQAEADTEACAKWGEYACFRMDEPLQNARAALRHQVQSGLDQQPVGGVARVTAWLDGVLGECDRQIGQMLGEIETQAETDAMLSAERGRLTALLESGLAAWPADNWQAWIGVSWRPWRWPRLIWRYWQMMQYGRQLSHILAQQADRRRQVMVNTAVRQAWDELEKITRRLQSQAEEIGEMLMHLAGEIAAEIPPPDDEQHLTVSDHLPITPLPIPHRLYAKLIPDEQAEAIAAAAAIGGLGQHVKRLDDAIIEPLRRLGGKRLAAVWALTAVDALAASADDRDQLQQWWTQGQDAARPLWRLDEARLDETARTENGRSTFVCGANAHLAADLLSEKKGAVCALPSGDRERLLILCVRTGLTVAAMVSESYSVNSKR